MIRKPDLTAIVIAKNEAAKLKACLQSLSFCREIIIIDDYSTDRTAALAREAGARVIKRHLKNDYAGQRNFGLKQSKSAWVLFVDADERVSPGLALEIEGKISAASAIGFYLRREDRFLGKNLRHGENFRNLFLRLGRRKAGTWVRPVHETWEINGPLATLANPLIHFPHRGIGEFLGKINRYTEIEAAYRVASRGRVPLPELLFFPVLKFIRSYFFWLGCFDGFPGLVMAYLMSLHSLVLRVKVRQLCP